MENLLGNMHVFVLSCFNMKAQNICMFFCAFMFIMKSQKLACFHLSSPLRTSFHTYPMHYINHDGKWSIGCCLASRYCR